MKVIITDDRFQGDYRAEEHVLTKSDIEMVRGFDLPRDKFLAELEEADGIMVNQYPMDKDTISGLKKCKVISRYGTGYEKVDIKQATEKGIWVARVPDYCYDEVAEHTLALLLGCARNIARLDKEVRCGEWNVHPKLNLFRVKGRILGIVGYGGTGRSFHKIAQSLKFSKVLICDHNVNPHNIASGEGEIVDFHTLLKMSDFVSLHIPMREENCHLLDKHAFSLMKSTAILINTSRGPIIDQLALGSAIEKGEIAGAGLDVFVDEPPDKKDPLMHRPEVILTDHCAYYSKESLLELKTKTAENVVEVLSGKPPLYPVNNIS